MEELKGDHNEGNGRQTAEGRLLGTPITSSGAPIRPQRRHEVTAWAMRGVGLSNGVADERGTLRKETLGELQERHRIGQAAPYTPHPDGILHLGRVVEGLVRRRPDGQRLQQAAMGVGRQPDVDHDKPRIETPPLFSARISILAASTGDGQEASAKDVPTS